MFGNHGINGGHKVRSKANLLLKNTPLLNTIYQEMRLQILASEIMENGCLISAMKVILTLH